MTTQEKLNELTTEIRKSIPRLMELEAYNEIIVPKDFSQQYFSYTIINLLESNSYRDNKQTWLGDILHDDIVPIVTVKNNAISYDLERYAVKDCIYNGKEPLLNDVLEWLSIISRFDEYCINCTGEFIEIHEDENDRRRWFEIENLNWDLSKSKLSDQSPVLINFLHNLIK